LRRKLLLIALLIVACEALVAEDLWPRIEQADSALRHAQWREAQRLYKNVLSRKTTPRVRSYVEARKALADLRVYADDNLNNCCREGDFSIFYSKEDKWAKEAAEHLLQRIKNRAAWAERTLGFRKTPLSFYILPERFSTTLWRARSPWLTYCPFTVCTTINGAWSGIPLHEAAHIQVCSSIEVSEKSFGVNEGVAELIADRRWGLPWRAWLAAAVKAKVTISLKELLTEEPFRDERMAVAYPLAGAFTAFALERCGKEGLVKILEGESLERVFGRPLGQIEKDWLNWAKTPIGDLTLELFRYRQRQADSLGAHATTKQSRKSFLGVDVLFTPTCLEITNVEPDSPAERAGLQAGDQIRSVNSQTVSGRNWWLFGATLYGQFFAATSSGEARMVELEVIKKGDSKAKIARVNIGRTKR